MDNLTISIKDFSIVPGTRKRDEGKNAHSGEEFREDYLIPKFLEAKEKGLKLVVNLDGTIGYGTSWLEEVFGGLTRQFGKQDVTNILEFISEEETYLIEDIKHYINHAEKNN